MPTDENTRAARADLNATLRGRLGGGSQPTRDASSGPQAVPAAVEQATANLRNALASGNSERIVQADDALAAAIDTASRPPAPIVERDWGQGARGTRTAPPETRSQMMSRMIRTLSMPNFNDYGGARGRPDSNGRIR